MTGIGPNSPRAGSASHAISHARRSSRPEPDVTEVCHGSREQEPKRSPPTSSAGTGACGAARRSGVQRVASDASPLDLRGGAEPIQRDDRDAPRGDRQGDGAAGRCHGHPLRSGPRLSARGARRRAQRGRPLAGPARPRHRCPPAEVDRDRPAEARGAGRRGRHLGGVRQGEPGAWARHDRWARHEHGSRRLHARWRERVARPHLPASPWTTCCPSTS